MTSFGRFFYLMPVSIVMMLAKDNTPCHAARSTQVILVTNKHSNGCTKYGLKSDQARMVHIGGQCACTAAATKSQGAQAFYSSHAPFYNSFFTDTLYHGEQCTLL